MLDKPMKKIIKIWDLILVAVMGIVGSGCILDPPAPEYGVEPLYGVQSTIQDSGADQNELSTDELSK
jgi:hypothetical protein